jgi:hypothetical protein
MAERDRGEAGEELGVLRLVPVGRELIGRAHDDRVPLESERLRRLQPGPKRLFRKLMARAIEDPRPDFSRRERHIGMWITREGRGSEAIRAMWKKQTHHPVLGAPFEEHRPRPLASCLMCLDLSPCEG